MCLSFSALKNLQNRKFSSACKKCVALQCNLLYHLKTQCSRVEFPAYSHTPQAFSPYSRTKNAKKLRKNFKIILFTVGGNYPKLKYFWFVLTFVILDKLDHFGGNSDFWGENPNSQCFPVFLLPRKAIPSVSQCFGAKKCDSQCSQCFPG